MELRVAVTEGWTPVRVHAERGTLEWRYTGALAFDDPFFEDTVRRAMARPYAVLFPRETPLDAPAPGEPGPAALPLAGLVLHMSRCGSTLVSRLLRAAGGTTVLAEPPPVDGVLRARFRVPGLARERQVAWLRGVVAALSHAGRPGDRRLVLKLDAWSALDLPLLLEAFPEVPWCFVYREPLEVLVSQMRQRGVHTVPGAIEPELFGFAADEPARLPTETFVARVLAAICRAALAADARRGIFVSYEELPGAVPDRIARHFGLSAAPLTCEALRELSRQDAKNPVMPFAGDSGEKRAAARPEWRRAAAEWIGPLYLALEARRTARTP